AGSFYTPIWKVRHVRIRVSGPIAASKVYSLSGLGHHRLMVDVDSGRITRRLDAVPTLGAAQVRRQWPSTVSISVSLRTPVAILQGSSEGSRPAPWLTVDVTGRILSSSAAPRPHLPVLAGVASPPRVGGWIARSPGPTAVPRSAASALVDMAAASDSRSVP